MLCAELEETYYIGTRSTTRAAGETLTPVHGIHKTLDPTKKPEHQRKIPGAPERKLTPISHSGSATSLDVQGSKTPGVIKPSINISPQTTPIPRKSMLSTKMSPNLQTQLFSVPQSLSQTLGYLGESDEDAEKKVTLKYTERKLAEEAKVGIDVGDVEVLDPKYVTPTNEDFMQSPPLYQVVDPNNVTYKFLLKQGDVDKLLKQIDQKVLRDTHLSVSLKDLKAAYFSSPHFRDIYLYLMQNRMPILASAARRLETNARNYMVIDGLLFKITVGNNGELEPLLCVPTSKVNVLLDRYHSSLMGGHVGITKCYQTISQRFYCPNLAEQLRAYITGCHMCQLFKKGKTFNRPFQKRININVPAMTKLSMDIKLMPASHGYTHILVLLCEVSNFMVALSLVSTKTQNILEAFQKGYLAYFGPPTHIICDQDPAFTSSLMEAFTQQLNIKVIMVSPTNHKSLLAEHGIKSLAGFLVKHLSEVWSWPNCLPYAMLCYNSYSTPNLDNMSPYELVFGHKASIAVDLEVQINSVVSRKFKDYHEKLKKNLAYMRERLQKFRSMRTDVMNRNKTYHSYEVGQIVYMYQARGSIVQTGSRKIACYFVGPLILYKAIGPNQFLLMSLTGQIYPQLIEETRLKPGSIWTSKGNVHTLAQLRQALGIQLSLKPQDKLVTNEKQN